MVELGSIGSAGWKKEIVYQYKAQVARVVDGDTVYVDVDLGFYLRQMMKLRLRSINTPEIRGEERPEGLRAKQFAEETLAQCPAVVIQTYKLGKYGRYIADLWYLAGCDEPAEILEKGLCLNQVLLEQELAEKVEY